MNDMDKTENLSHINSSDNNNSRDDDDVWVKKMISTFVNNINTFLPVQILSQVDCTFKNYTSSIPTFFRDTFSFVIYSSHIWIKVNCMKDVG